MSNLAKTLVAELEREAASTRRVLERVPADQLEFQPHPKSMKLGALALHVANLPGAFSRMGRLDSFDVSTAKFSPPLPESVDQILATLDASLADARQFLSEQDDASLAAPWRLMAGPNELFTVPRSDVVRNLMFNHTYHHRGQLTVYLRMLDVALPSIYGPSADENPFAAKMAA